MDDEATVFTILGVIGALAAVAAIVAAIKGRSSFGWLIATLAFPPLLIPLLMLPSLRGGAASPKRSTMPAWTQPPAEAGSDPAATLQAALARMDSQVESQTGKRILAALSARAGQAVERNKAASRRASTPTAAPAPKIARSASSPSMSAPLRPPSRTVQRSGSRETRIYRRT